MRIKLSIPLSIPRSMESLFIGFCKRFGRRFHSNASDELKEALTFLGWTVSPGEIVGAGKAAMVMLIGVAAIAAILSVFIKINPLIIVFMVPLAIMLFYTITEWPKTVARERALDALGQSPHIIAKIAIPLKQKPNLEHALTFVAEQSEGPIADDIRNAVWDSLSGKVANLVDGLSAVAKRWGKWSPGFQRSLNLIAASFHESDIKKKHASLDASISSILDDITTRTREYMQSLNMPTLILFSIGMVLPLMMVSLFPLLSLFGFAGGPSLLTMFLAISLIGSYLYSNTILRKRPPTFSRQTLAPTKHLKIGKHSFEALPLAIVVGLIVATPGLLYLFSESGIVLSGPLSAISAVGTIIVLWGIALAGAIYCYGTAKSVADEHRKSVNLEDGFVDGITHIRNRLNDGRPLEDAIDFASTLTVGESANLFKSIANKMKTTAKPFEKVVAELDTPSLLVKSTLSMLSSSVRHGLTATAQTANVLTSYLRRMKRSEKSLAIMLERSLSMMKATAMTFAPIICAVIVVLFQIITDTIKKTGQQFASSGQVMDILQITTSPETLQLIVGLYALALNFVLLRYVSRMQNGTDSIPFRMDLAKALPIAMILFTVTLIGARMMLANSM